MTNIQVHNLKFVPSQSYKKYISSVSVTFLDRDVSQEYKTSVALQGWVTTLLGKPTTLLVTCKGMIVGATRFLYDRPDVLRKLQITEMTYKPGYHVRLSTLCLPQKLTLEIWVDITLDNGQIQRVSVGEVVGTLGALPAGIADSRYAPIIVPALGRSGTTLMMGLLNSHPQIVAPGKYPYEYRQASYFWHALRVITSPANFELSMHPDSFEANHFYNVGQNPYLHRMYHRAHDFEAVADWQDEAYPVAAINFFKEMVDQYLDRVLQDTKRVNVQCLAEKAIVSPLSDLVMNLYPNAKQIFLVRDLRDSFLSAKAFNEKRGTRSFGFDGRTDQQVLASRAYIANMMVAAHKAADDRTLFVRYEDLILKQNETLTTIVGFLGLDTSATIINTMIDSQLTNSRQHSVHATTTSAVSSVERWRTELSDADQEYCSKAYRVFFETFGYPRR